MDTCVDVDRPLEQLEATIFQGAANLTAAEHDWLLAVAEFDRREGWKLWECYSCAAWLSWQVGLDIRAAREKVRVARALEQFPLIAAAMATGRLSYSKVRAVTRIATAECEQALVEMALAGTTNHVDAVQPRMGDVRCRTASLVSWHVPLVRSCLLRVAAIQSLLLLSVGDSRGRSGRNRAADRHLSGRGYGCHRLPGGSADHVSTRRLCPDSR